MSDLQFNFQNRHAIVTGGGADIGEAIARALAAAGASVLVNDLNPDRAERVAAEIRAGGGQAQAWQADVSNRYQVGSLIEGARDWFGRIDILVNAAGIFKVGPMPRLDEWDWRRILEVNLTGAFFCSQLAGRVMAEEGGGVIVNIASTAGHGVTLPDGVGYAASKAGLIGMTRQCAREFAPLGIRVNAVCPGNIADGEVPALAPANALGLFGQAADIASVTLFLCSEGARFITGQAINVDGGQAMT